MSDPGRDHEQPRRQLDDLELSTETVQDLTESEAEGLRGGLLQATIDCLGDTAYCFGGQKLSGPCAGNRIAFTTYCLG
jgi:hypothetical protein